MTKSKANEKPIFYQKGTISSVDMIFCCLNSTIGLGSLKLGAVFTTGLIVSYLLLSILCYLSFYSFKLLILSAATCHESTFEEIWLVQFSKKSIIVPVFFTSISTLVSMVGYIREIQTFAITICSKISFFISGEPNSIYLNLENFKMLIGCLVFVIFLIPVCFMKNIYTMVIISYISMSFFLLFVIYLISMFGYEVKRTGFNQNHSFKLFHIKDHLPKSISTSIFAFNFHPLTYPGLRHVKCSTKQNLLNIVGVTMITILVNYIIVGTFSYLTFFDKNTNGIILDYYPENTKSEKILAIIGQILCFGFILLTIPFRLNSCRYVILNTINNDTSFPPDIWIFLGIIISLLALSFANLTDEYLNILFVFSDAMACFLLFIFTPIFYLKTNGTTHRFNTFMSILFLIIGLTASIFMVLYEGFY